MQCALYPNVNTDRLLDLVLAALVRVNALWRQKPDAARPRICGDALDPLANSMLSDPVTLISHSQLCPTFCKYIYCFKFVSHSCRKTNPDAVARGIERHPM